MGSIVVYVHVLILFKHAKQISLKVYVVFVNSVILAVLSATIRMNEDYAITVIYILIHEAKTMVYDRNLEIYEVIVKGVSVILLLDGNH